MSDSSGKTGRPEPGTDSERRLAEALAEFVDRRAREEPVEVEQFCRAHPDLASDLRPTLEALTTLDRLQEPDAPAEREDDELPDRLSGHAILGRIGSGGMGCVYLAADEGLGRRVAIKTLAPRFRDNPQVRSRFMQEARSLARLSHPHIVRIYNLGGPDEEPHFVMEHLTGTPLTEAARALTIHQKAELMRKVALAVDFLHTHGIIHRDLKPANILVGPDLEPKLLDFGLARRLDEEGNLTLAGELMGTPPYFSPEQTRGGPVDARSDVFSLGTVLYELLAGALPFRGDSLRENLRRIREEKPVLPRRINSDVPGPLQNICMQALEKLPEHRYGSAREMADDLERFLAGEPVAASPRSYADRMAGAVEQHLRELEGWKQDQILSEFEFEGFRKSYGRLLEREDAWILAARRLSLPQVSLYLGAWVLVTGAALLFLFRYIDFPDAGAVLAVTAATGTTGYFGIRLWRQGQLRIAVAFLLAFCLVLPILLLVVFNTAGLFTGLTLNAQGAPDEGLEPFQRLPEPFRVTTNAQLWWSLLISLPAYVWLRRYTQSSVFVLLVAVMGALWSLTALLRMGAMRWLQDNPEMLCVRLLPVALLFFLAGWILERLELPNDSRYFYPVGLVFAFAGFTGMATYEHDALNGAADAFVALLSRHIRIELDQGALEWLFIVNAGIYYALHLVSERLRSRQMRMIAAKAFRFVIPGHVLTSLLLLGLDASSRWNGAPEDMALKSEARFYEFLLPAVACLFVFWSISRQMKNYFATGSLFLAIGFIRLQQNFFQDRAVWPISLLVAGAVLMLIAWRYALIKLTLLRWLRRLRKRMRGARSSSEPRS